MVIPLPLTRGRGRGKTRRLCVGDLVILLWVVSRAGHRREFYFRVTQGDVVRGGAHYQQDAARDLLCDGAIRVGGNDLRRQLQPRPWDGLWPATGGESVGHGAAPSPLFRGTGPGPATGSIL